MSQENKALVQRFVEESFNQGNLNVVDEVYAPSFISHDPDHPEEVRSPEYANSSSVSTAAPSPTDMPLWRT
jgi:hypothetical protein